MPTEGQEDEEGVSLDMQGVHSDFSPWFHHHLRNVPTVGESARGKDQAAWTHPHPGCLLEGMVGGGGCKK